MCTGTTRTCVTTCGRGAGTHGGRFESTHGSFWDGHTEEREGERRERGRRSLSVLLTVRRAQVELSRASERFTERKPLVLTHSRFENKSTTTRSRVLQSVAIPDEAVELHFILRDTTHNTQPLRHTTHNTTHTQKHAHATAPTHTLQPTHPTPLSSPPSPHPSPSHTHTQTHMYMHVYLCMCKYMHIYMCICISISVSACVSVSVSV